MATQEKGNALFGVSWRDHMKVPALNLAPRLPSPVNEATTRSSPCLGRGWEPFRRIRRNPRRTSEQLPYESVAGFRWHRCAKAKELFPVEPSAFDGLLHALQYPSLGRNLPPSHTYYKAREKLRILRLPSYGVLVPKGSMPPTASGALPSQGFECRVCKFPHVCSRV